MVPGISRRLSVSAVLLLLALLSPVAAQAAPSVYAGNLGGGNVSLFQADTSGLLTPQTPATVAAASPDGLAISPDQDSLYVANSVTTGTVSQFDIDAGGTPTPKSPATVAAGSFPGGMVVSPDGNSAYVSNNGSSTISQYDVDVSGKLTPKTPPTVATDTSPFGIAISPDGSNVYVTNYVAPAGGSITQYTVGAGGLLSAKTPGSVAAGAFPAGVTVSPDGQSVYSTELNSFFVRQWDVAGNGTLSPKDPATVTAGTFPTSIVVSPDGSSAYATNQQTDEISQYDVGAGGKLTAKTPATVAGGDNPFGLAIDAAGENVYVSAYLDAKLRHYAVGAGGVLTLNGTPNDLGSSARQVVVRNDVIGPDASIDSGPNGAVATGDATFTFSANEPGSTFECNLDDAGFVPCTSPQDLSGLAEGDHAFGVRATDPWANTGGALVRNWTVEFPAPPNDFSFGKAKLDRTKGTAVLPVNVPGAGHLTLAASKTVKAFSIPTESAGNTPLAVRPFGKAKKKLRKTGRASVTATVTFTPDGGEANTQSTTLTLKKKKRK